MFQIKRLLSVIFLFFIFTNLFAQPTITQQPTNQLVSVGQSATFSLTATTPNPTSFQWYKNGVLIASATSTSYTTPPTNLGDNGAVFYCIVSDSVGSVQSNNATLTVGESPTITQEPSSIAVTEGDGATFNISASGTATLLYQWKKNGVDIVGATTNVYNIASTTLSDNGNVYTCSVTNDFGSDLSIGATLTVNAAAPVITVQPIDQDVYVGETATFTLEATSSVPMSFQWYANGTPIPGATSASYTTDPIPNLDPDGTILYCIVTNASGSAQSDNAILNVSMPPGRVTDNLQVLYDFKEGDGTTINDVSGVGTPLNLTISNPSAVSWTEDGLDLINSSSITSETPATKIIDSCKATNELTVEAWIRPADVIQGDKTARIITMAENADDRNFVVAQTYDIINIATRTSSTDNSGHPGSWAEDAFETSLMHLVYTRASNGDNRLYVNGELITNNNVTGDFSNWNSSYKLGLGNEINDTRKSWEGAFYLVAIYNKALQPFEISHNFNESIPLVNESPTIIMNPRYQGALTGESIEFRVGAVGKLPMTYQWQVDTGAGFTNIAGANKSFYGTPAVTVNDNKNDYRCIITNSQGSVTSNYATLYVTPSNSKVLAGKEVEYKFQEGSGNIISDVSGTGVPLNLTIQDQDAVEWTQYGLNIIAPAGIVSSTSASKIIDASVNSHEFTFEAWIKPANSTLSKLSRIAAISNGELNRNFYFAQNNNSYEMRTRLTTNISGSQNITTSSGIVNTEKLTHIAFTTNEFGIRKLFIDGVEVNSNHNYGIITNWDNTFSMSLGGEVDNSYSWEGLLNYVAMYGRALSPTEISHNYSFGIEGGFPTIATPGELVLEKNGSKSISLSWTDNSDNESGFIIERSVTDSLSYARIDSVGPNMITYTDTTISESMKYFYRVIAYNVAVQSEYSNELEVVSLLNEPSNLTAQAQVFGEIILRWDENSEVEDGIVIERGEGDPLTFTSIDTVESNVNSYFDQTVGDKVNYSYRLYAFNSSSNSEYSNTVNITSLFAEIPSPSNLSIDLHPIYGVPVLNWVDESNNENGFIIERKIAGAEYSIIDTVEADTTYYMDPTVEENTIYLYRVFAYNENTTSDYSNIVDVNVLTDVVNNEIPSKFGLSQNYPNPFNPTTKIHFDLPEASKVNLTIYNMLGQKVMNVYNKEFSAGSYEYSFNGTDLTSGIYIFSIKANGVSGKSFSSAKKMILMK